MSLLTQASLVITPNGVKEGKLYSVIPSDGSGDMSVVRATTATRVNSSGLVELVPYNYIPYSQEFSNSSFWSYYILNVTANTTTAPDGTLTADTITLTGTNGSTYQSVSGLNASVHTISAYFKKTNENNVYIDLNTSSGYGIGYFNLSTLVASVGAGAFNPQIESVGNGWYRCSFQLFASGNGSFGFGVYAGAGQSAFVWGAQLVEGSTAKDYQKTETRLNIPRLDYSNGTCPSLLVEPQRTNTLFYSEQFDNAYWLGNTTKTANNTIAPNGINSADRINATAINFFHRVNGLSSVNSGTAYTFSVYAKANTLGFIQLALNTGFTLDYTLSPYANFNLTTGVVTQNGNGATAQIESLGNGWYRCSITATSILTIAGEVNINLINSGTLTAFEFWSATATDSLFIWGAQLELGSYSSSFIPTTSASVTRNADVVSKTGISSLIGQTEGTIFVDFWNYDNTTNKSGWNICINGGGYGNAIYFEKYLGAWSGLIWNGYTNQFADSAGGALSVGRHKMAIAYKTNDIAVYCDGVLTSTDTTATIPTCSRLDIGFIANDVTPEELGFNAGAIWKTRLTNIQLAQLTTI